MSATGDVEWYVQRGNRSRSGSEIGGDEAAHPASAGPVTTATPAQTLIRLRAAENCFPLSASDRAARCVVNQTCNTRAPHTDSTLPWER